MAQKTVGPFADDDVTKKAIIDFSVKNQQKMLDISKEMKVLDGLSGKKITLAVTSGKLGKDFANVLKKDIDRFNKYNDAGKVTYIRELKQIMAMEGDKTMQNAYKAWVGEMGDPTLTFEDFAIYQSDRTVRDSGIDQTTGPGAQKKKEPEAPKPSILDPYVQALKEASNWQQRLTTGWNASLKALKNYSDKAIKTMAGSAIIMQQAGADANFIQAFLGGTEEEQNKIINKTTGKLTKVGKDLIAITKKVEDAKIGMAYILMSASDRLAKDNELYQAGLEVISIKEKKINDKYDARVKALDEIGKMQDRNNQYQQDTLDLAGALSRGDIAAAAQIALKAKQNAQKQALEDAKASLELQRKNEINAIEVIIGGHVQKRSDLEKLIADNSERIAAAKLLEMDRQAQIHKDALASAKAVAQMLADGKKIAALPGYNGYNGQQKKQQQQYGNDPSKAGQMGYDKKGNVVSNPYQGMAALRLDKQGKQAVWDFKNAKWTTAAWDKNAGKVGYVQDKNSPGKWVTLAQSGVDVKKFGPAAFATKEAAEKAAGAGEKPVWEYNYQTNQGFWTTKKGALGTQENPITAPQPKSGSSMVNFRGEKFQVEKNKYFRMPPGVYVYSVIKTGKGYEITYGDDGMQSEVSPTTGSTQQALPGLEKQEEGMGYGYWNATAGPDGKGEWSATKWFPPAAKFARGGLVPKGYVSGGPVYGTDTIPAMLTPGEFVMTKSTVDRVGAANLGAVNNGTSVGESVYNYNVTLNVSSSSDANDIADAVLTQIKRLDSQRVRSSVI
jgi:hypothetical protein